MTGDYALEGGQSGKQRLDVAELRRLMLDGPDAPVPGRALDVGWGSGGAVVHLAKRRCQVTAVDAVENALANAKQRARRGGLRSSVAHRRHG